MRTHSPMCRLVSPVGDTRGDALALVETLAETLAEMEAKTLGESKGNASALVNTVTETLAEVEAVRDKRSDAYAML